MPRNLQINTGVIISQDQNNSYPINLPNNSVSLAHLMASARLALQNATLTVGSATDVLNGIADYSSMVSAIAALNSGGGKILLRNSYTGAENVSLNTNIHIEGQGHLSVLGTITFTGDYNSVQNLKHGNLIFNAGSDMNLVNNTWLINGSTEVRVVEE
jgi:hypothetical protein